MKRINNKRNEYIIPYKLGSCKSIKCTKLDYLVDRHLYSTKPLTNKERKELKELLFWFRLKHKVAKTYLKWTKRDIYTYEDENGSIRKVGCTYLSIFFFRQQYGIGLTKRACEVHKHLCTVKRIYEVKIK